MTADRDALLDVLGAIERHLVGTDDGTLANVLDAAARARRYLSSTVEPRCSCAAPGSPPYEGPEVDCDAHGSPSAAFRAGRREGAQDERDQARIRGDLCRWCYRTPIAGERHGHMIPGGQEGNDPEVACLDRDGGLILHNMTDPCPWGEQPGDPWANLARDAARRERAAYAAGRAAGAGAHA